MEKITHTAQEILEQAIQAVEHETGLVLTIEQTKVPIDDGLADVILRLEPAGLKFAVEIKKWAQQVNLGVLMNRVQQIPGEGLLVADYVNPRMGDKLRRQGVQFIDTAGNAYINQPPVYVYVTGHRPGDYQLMPYQGGAKRAFEPKGLMVIYAFLCQPGLVNAPYREIAKVTDVAVGTVNKVIDALKAAGFVRDVGRKEKRQLVDYERLLERWVEAWPEKLRPKQFFGEFVAMDPYWWKGINMEKYGGYWGGEIAGAIYTDYLKPEIATVYLPKENLNEFLMDMRLRKATEWNENTQGQVMIYHAFWDERLDVFEPIQKPGVVHPILAYADLVATGDTRNLEVARMIYDRYIAEYYRED